MGEGGRVRDDLYSGVSNGNICLRELGEWICYGGGDMGSGGVEVGERGGGIGVLGDMGIEGCMGGR